ncbi:MAG: sigma-70 family RNA polymerase sigma factor [Verrucomicrobiae bacterium]|nr:sigma-70 family RNA polymerase sigma factor [Verrucomicrobiae bacterium]MCX7722805.1 sigma-70 family RNA polymerase sigma factor [Verrucomicrobiae bacterium]
MRAFEELVARHRDKVYSRAYSIVRNEADALDISQEAWVKAWQRLGQFHGQASFATWVTRIVINLCVDWLRQRNRLDAESIEQWADELGGIEQLLPREIVNPTAQLEREELRQRIDAALGQLSETHRLVLILHEFEGMKYKQIAKLMGCSLGTVMSRLFYARRRLAALLASVIDESRK